MHASIFGCYWCLYFCPSYKRSGPTTYFWYRETLNIAPSIESSSGLNWKLAVSLLAAWIIVYLCMVKGIKSSGKVRRFCYWTRRQITGNINKLGRHRELNLISGYLDFFFSLSLTPNFYGLFKGFLGFSFLQIAFLWHVGGFLITLSALVPVVDVF